MFTLDDITNILDSEDYTSVDGYNLIRTNLLTALSGAPGEFAAQQAEIEKLKAENERLKQANITLYSRVEKQIVKPDDKPDDKPEDKPETQPDFDEILEENVKSYMEVD